MDDLYERELSFLKRIKDILGAPDERDWRAELEGMAKAYEELLFTSIKLNKATDRQHAWLIETTGRLQQANLELQEVSSVDALTGLLNRFRIEGVIQAALEGRDRGGATSSLILIDLDRFKAINDTHGHNAGDAVLRIFADLLRKRLRSTDFGARWGGDEFLVVLPGAGGRQAFSLAEAVREAVARAEFPVSPVTISLGTAELGPDMDRDAWLAAADVNLYRAKRGGRNRTCGAADAAPGSAREE